MKKETGRGIKDHVNNYVIKKLKDYWILINPLVRSHLVFQYPHSLTRLFSKNVGMSPNEFRRTDFHQ